MDNLEKAKIPENWELINLDAQSKFFYELKRELPLGHVLFDIDASVIARRKGTDDFLFLIEHPEFRYAEVHLTWRIETNPKWPFTSLFRTLNEWKNSLENDFLD